MGIHSYITDPKTHNNAHIVHINEDTSNVEYINKNALVVATHPLKIYEHDIRFFTNPLYGSNLNIAVAFGGSPEVIYTENSEWTTSAISGTWDFASTDFAQAGSVSIDATSTANSDIAQFSKGSDLDLTNYTSITGYIYITRWDAIGVRSINITGWDVGSSSTVGATVEINDYVDTTILNSWQQFSILLSDLELTGKIIDSIRITTIFTGGGGLAPQYYLDTINIEQKGATDPQIFAITPDLGTWLHIEEINLFIADDDFDSTVADSTLLKLPYKTMLGESLSLGLPLQMRRNDVVLFNHIIKNLSDFLSLGGAEIVASGSDGATNTWMSLRLTFSEPIVLRSEDKEQLCIVVSEDLSGLDVLRGSANSRIERRQ